MVRKRRLFFESTFLEKKLHSIRMADNVRAKDDPLRLGNFIAPENEQAFIRDHKLE